MFPKILPEDWSQLAQIGDPIMRAILNGHIIAESDDIEIGAGYKYFPASATHLDLLQKAPKTEADLACPHNVQFYDVVIDGVRHERAAWSPVPLCSTSADGSAFGMRSRSPESQPSNRH